MSDAWHNVCPLSGWRYCPSCLRCKLPNSQGKYFQAPALCRNIVAALWEIQINHAQNPFPRADILSGETRQVHQQHKEVESGVPSSMEVRDHLQFGARLQSMMPARPWGSETNKTLSPVFEELNSTRKNSCINRLSTKQCLECWYRSANSYTVKSS